MVRIVMDSAGDLPPEWVTDYDIDVIPINIMFGSRSFLQGIDISDEDFYLLADGKGVVPKTSQPSPQQFINFYKRIAQLGDTILSLHISSKLSGTFESAVMAARELKDQLHIIPFDSGCGSAALGYICREARIMERAGASVQTIMDRLDFIRRNVTIILTLDTLEYALKSGRVKALQAALISLLNIKPIIVLRDGALDMADMVRTRRRALDRLVDSIRQRVGERLVNVAVVHARDVESAQTLLEVVRKTLNCREIVMTNLSVSVAANLGPGTVGIVAYPVEEG